MSNGVHPRTPRPAADSGTQPPVHYCTSRARGDGSTAGCPLWPDCLFPGQDWRSARGQLTTLDSDEPDDDEIPGIAKSLAALAGFAAAACVLFPVVVAALLPLFV